MRSSNAILLITGLLLCNVCNAQVAEGIGNTYYVEHFGEDEGLPQNSINSILPDNNDFLWIATEGGITRFNGNRFLSVAGTGNASDVNLTRVKNFYYKGKDTIIAYSTANKRVAVIVNNKIVAEEDYQFRKYGLLVMNRNHSVPIPDSYPNLRSTDDDKQWNNAGGGIYGATYNKDTFLVRIGKGVGIYDAKGKIGEVKFDITNYTGIVFLNDRWLYLDKDNYINFYSISGFQKKELLDIHAKQIKLYSNSFGNNFYCVADSDLYLVDVESGKIQFRKILTDLQRPEDISTIYQKDSNTIVVGTIRNGLYVYKKRFFQTTNPLPTGESDVFYGQILLPDNETILAGTDFLFRDGKYLGSSKSVFVTNVSSSLKDSKGYYWYVVGENVLRASSIGITPDTMTFLPGVSRDLLFEDSDGNVWIHSTTKFGYFSNGKFTELKFGNLNPGLITCMRRDNGGRYWIGTHDGLFILKDLHQQDVQSVSGFKLHDVRFIWPEANGQVWVCTYGQGFYLITKSETISFPQNNGSLAYVHCIVEDAKGYFWIPTNNGLFVTAKQSLMNYAKNSNDVPFYYRFTKKHGFRTNEFNGGGEPAFLRLPNGTISLASMQGLVSFDPTAINFNFSSSPILVDNIETDSTEIAERDGFDIASNIRNIRFTISSSFWGERENDLLEYAVLEKGKTYDDGIWLPVGNSGRINLFTPSDGHYRLVIRKRKGLQAGNYVYKEISFRVLPKWYRTDAVIVVALIGVALLMVGMFYFRRRYYRRANRLLKEKVDAATFELQQLNNTLEEKIVERTEAITHAETRFRILSENALVGVYIIADGKFSYVNPTFAQIFGYESSELVGADANIIVHRDNDTEATSNIQKRLRGEVSELRYEFNGVCKNGEIRNIDVYGSSVVLNNETVIIGNIIDVTDRKRSEIKIKESEVRFREVLENSLSASFKRNLITNTYDYLSPVFEKMTGFSKEDMNTMPLEDVIALMHPDDIQTVKDGIAGAISKRDGSANSLEYRFKHKTNGDYRWLLDEFVVMHDEQGRAISFIGSVSDITERKESELKFKNLVEKSLVGVYIIQKGKFVYVNPKYASDLGYTQDEMLNFEDVTQIVDETYTPEPLLEWRHKVSNGIVDDFHIELKYKRKNGASIWAEVLCGETFFNGSKAIIGAFLDVNERKQIETELIESKEQLSLFIKHSPAALAMFDKDMKYIQVSQRWLTDYNLKESDVIGKSHYEVFPTIGDEWKQIHQRCLAGAVEKSEEDSFVREDGSINWLRWEIHPWRKASGEIGGIIMLTEVITKLKESELKFKNLVEDSPFGVYIRQKERFVYVNPRFEKDLGYTNEELLSMANSKQIVYRDDLAITYEQDKRREQNLIKSNHGILRYRRKDGKIFWGEVYSTVTVFNGTEAIIGSLMDVTERKEAEEQQQLMASIVNSSDDAIISKTLDGTITSWNHGAEKLLGYLSDEIVNKNISVMIPQNLRDEEKYIMSNVRKGKSVDHYETSRRKKSGELIDVSLTISPIVDSSGKIVGASKILRDVTERKKAAKALQQNEERNRALIENISDTIILIDNNMKVVYQSPSFVRTAGFTIEDHKERTVLDVMHPDEIQECLDVIENAKTYPSVPIPFLLRTRHRDGHYIWVEGTVTNLVHNDSVKAFVLNYRNVTERKVMETEKQKILDEVVQRNRDLEQFAYIVSHNLRAPVANIIGITEFLLDTNIDADDRKHMTDGLSSSVQKLDGVIQDLNTILQTRREIAENKEPVRFSGLVKDIMTSIATLIDKEQVFISYDFSQVDEMVTIKSYLHSIFYNLVSNAIKYRRPDVTPVIDIASKVVGDKIEITFKDNGLGIDLSKNKDQLFGLYKRFHTDRAEGKGMGLYMVKTQVETIGGKISVDSTVQQGTTFTLRFEKHTTPISI